MPIIDELDRVVSELELLAGVADQQSEW
jgi:hypothetical protein